jgi:hypothetical protein
MIPNLGTNNLKISPVVDYEVSKRELMRIEQKWRDAESSY